MQIQVNTDRHINGNEALVAKVREELEGALGRFRDRVTRVEVHLSDENSSQKGGEDMRCVLEARLEGRSPSVVTHQAETVEQAVIGAAQKLKRSLASTIERQRE